MTIKFIFTRVRSSHINTFHANVKKICDLSYVNLVIIQLDNSNTKSKRHNIHFHIYLKKIVSISDVTILIIQEVLPFCIIYQARFSLVDLLDFDMKCRSSIFDHFARPSYLVQHGIKILPSIHMTRP